MRGERRAGGGGAAVLVPPEEDGKVSKGALAVSYDLDDTVADQLIDRLELEGVISPEDDLGGREIITVQ